jgi:intracellular sulfur oxidation DsrE/DsrF family protein
MTGRNDDGQGFTARRGFLGRLIGSAAAITLLGATPKALLADDRTELPGGAGPGDDWMAELKGSHRTVFDMSAHKNGKPLTQAKNYLDAWRDAFKVPEHDINLVIGVHGDAIPVVLTDALWSRFKIGEQYEVTDGGTKSAGVRNAFSAANAAAAGLVTPDQSIEGLQKRGVRFLICMNTIAGATKKLSAAGLGGADEIHAALLGGMLPGVITVPAMVVALTQLQEHGVKYVKIAG